ncbi:MAG: hypothetical protein JWM93_3639, partial [Frankiales bacterium]|nr:hypothetical protein [Frankiales bacterium]
MLKRWTPVVTSAVVLALAVPATSNAATAGAGPVRALESTTTDPTPTPTPAPDPVPVERPSTERMTHWTCDRKGVANVAVTWLSPRQATVDWKLTDRASDGRAPLVKIVAVSFNGAAPDTRAYLFGGSHEMVALGGIGTVRSGKRTWTPHITTFDKIEVWIYNGRGSERAACGYNIIKRLNDFVYPTERTDPTPYAKSKAIRD